MSGEAEVVAVICPLVSEQMSDSEQALEAVAIDVENAAELLEFATAAAFGKWRDDENVTLTKTRHVTVNPAEMSRCSSTETDKRRQGSGNSFVPNTTNVIVSENPLSQQTN